MGTGFAAGAQKTAEHRFCITFATTVAHMAPKDAIKKYEKWSSRVKANIILQEGLKSGKIDPSMKPKEVWESNNEFQKYSLPSFRSAFNRKKTEMGVHVREEGKLRKQILCATHSNFM